VAIRYVCDHAEAWVRKLPVLQEVRLVRPLSAPPLLAPCPTWGLWGDLHPQRSKVGGCFPNMGHHPCSGSQGFEPQTLGLNQVPEAWISPTLASSP
jgi:hypothetical protein